MRDEESQCWLAKGGAGSNFTTKKCPQNAGEIWNTEEKGSDVNLATYLIHDAWRDLFDVAVVLSQDTDLNEPVRIVRYEIKKSIGVIVLDGKAPGKLSTFGSFVRHITPADLAASHFPIAFHSVSEESLLKDLPSGERLSITLQCKG